MLRSLVGSEMCIRDRTIYIIESLYFFILQSPGNPNFFPLISNPLMIITCLLYTSDAADDLLCVDLGGRRIIKKKKQKHIH